MTKSNFTKFIILGLLNQQPLTGYLIRKFVQRSISFFWNLSNGQIYPTLRKLEADGLVAMQKCSSRSGPESKIYRITESGKNALEEWLNESVPAESFRSPLMLKLFLSGNAYRELNLKNLKRFLKISQENLTVMELYEKNLKNILGESSENLHIYLTVLRGKQFYSGNIQWAEQAIKELKKEKNR